MREYARTGNATRAAILAGYSPRAGKQIGSRLLKRPSIREALTDIRGAQVPEGIWLDTQWALQKLLEETADPNPRIRLDAIKAIGQAVGVFNQKEQDCPRCGLVRELEALSPEDLRLRAVGIWREQLESLDEEQFEALVRSVREQTEACLELARSIRARQSSHLAPDFECPLPKEDST